MLKRIFLVLALTSAAAGAPAQAPEGDIPPVTEQAPGAPPVAPPAPQAAPTAPPPAAVAPTISTTGGGDAPNEERRRANVSEFERKVEVEEAGKRAEQAVETGRAEQEEAETERLLRESAAEARRRAEAERRAEIRRRVIARERSCVIKPVMTDAEIAHCKWVWSFPPPG